MSELNSRPEEIEVDCVVKYLNKILSYDGYDPDETPVLVELQARSPMSPQGGCIWMGFHCLFVKTRQLPELVREMERVEKALGKANQTSQGRTA